LIKRFLLIFAALCSFLWILSPLTAHAQGELTVTASSAAVTFPMQINFSMKASGTATITDIRLRYSVDQESFADVVAEAYVPFTPAASVNALYSLDMRKTGGLPPGTTIRYWWVVTDSSGAKVISDPIVVNFDDNRYQWKNLSEGLINLYWYSGDSAFANKVMTAAKDSLTKLAQNTGAQITRPIKMYVYASTQDLLGALMFPYEWTGAVTYSQFGTIAIGLAPSNIEWGKMAVAHELSHLAIHQVTMNPYNDLPRWLDEGLAVYAEGAVDVSFSTAVYNAVQSGTLISVQSLASPFSADSTLAALSYGESFSIVDYLISTYGENKMLDLLTVFQKGSTYNNALTTVYGFDMTGLNTLWQKYINDLYKKPAATTGVSA
jgi:hypothetical protein